MGDSLVTGIEMGFIAKFLTRYDARQALSQGIS